MNETEKFTILGKMSAMLAHEIRNPLAGISAVTQVLEGKIDKDDPRRKYVSLIMKEIDRVNKIVHDLLDYTRESRPYFVQTELTALTDRALAASSEELEKKGIKVERDYGSGNFPVKADQEKIERVFRSIIVNAIEAMEKGGVLTTIVRQATGTNGGERGAEIAFSDTGKGCVLDDLKEMFSPFYTTKMKGTGLGLAVGSKVIEEHNGRLMARKNQGMGLTMTVFLPSEQPKERTPE